MRSLLAHLNHYKKILLFFHSYKNEWKERKFWTQKNQKKQFLQKQKSIKDRQH